MPNYTGTTKDGKVVSKRSMSPQDAEQYFDHFVTGPLFANPVRDGDTYREATAEELATVAAAKARASALARDEFDKAEIVDAMIALEKDDAFFAILDAPENVKVRRRYDAYQTIKLSDPDTQAVLSALSIDVDTVKLQIAGIE